MPSTAAPPVRSASGSPEDGQWKAETFEVVRAASGGLLFGVPLLYTMEIWWIGATTEPAQMLLLLALLAVVILGLNLTAGFRTTRDVRLRDALADTIEAMAIGIVVTAAVLLMLRELRFDTPITPALGKIVYEAIPFCLGIGVARFLLDGDPDLTDPPETDGDDDGDGSTGGDEGGGLSAGVADLAATVVGATFIGLSIAPTDEVPMLASTMSPAWQLAVIAASLVTSYAIVFVAGFSRQPERRAQQGIFQRPGVETIVTYLAAVVVAVLLLWLFQRGLHPLDDLLSRAVVLGFPATIGGAVGRLAL